MVGVYRNWHTLDNPDAYLRAAVVNRARNAHRNRARHKAKLPLLFEADRVDFAAAELNDAVARLPFRQRAVLVMRYYLGLREAEIAEALGCRPGTVKSLASRALARLATEVPR
jgi:RNA polymerase sigma factor (sigma-70 family)